MSIAELVENGLEFKTCTACKVPKLLTEYRMYRHKGKLRPPGKCRPCQLAYRREKERESNILAKRKRAEDPEHRRHVSNGNHKWRYGITLDEKEALLAAQGGVCASCGTDEPRGNGWATDHDHACCPGIKACGKCIRGILCSRCNMGLGQFDDDPDKLQAAIAYLERTRINA